MTEIAPRDPSLPQQLSKFVTGRPHFEEMAILNIFKMTTNAFSVQSAHCDTMKKPQISKLLRLSRILSVALGCMLPFKSPELHAQGSSWESSLAELRKRHAKELLALYERLHGEQQVQIEKAVKSGQLEVANQAKEKQDATEDEMERLKDSVSMDSSKKNASSEFARTAKGSQWRFSGTINLKRILFDGNSVRSMSEDGEVIFGVMADRNDFGSVFSGSRDTGGRNVFLFSPDLQKVIIFTTSTELTATLKQP